MDEILDGPWASSLQSVTVFTNVPWLPGRGNRQTKKYILQGLIIYTPLNITAIKSRMKWAAHVAHMGM